MSRFEELVGMKRVLAERVEEIDKEVSGLVLTYDEWSEYAAKKDYNYLSHLPYDLREFIDEYIVFNKHGVMTLKNMEESIAEMNLDSSDRQKVFGMLHAANFGSVICDW